MSLSTAALNAESLAAKAAAVETAKSEARAQMCKALSGAQLNDALTLIDEMEWTAAMGVARPPAQSGKAFRAIAAGKGITEARRILAA